MISPEKRLYLASQSPRRAQLLEQINVGFELLAVEVDETPREQEKAIDYVERLAVAKARAGWKQLDSLPLSRCRLPVLGADTTVVLDGQILGKPINRENAVAMLKALSANTHQVMTAVCLYYGGLQLSTVIVTDVVFRAMTEREISDYWDSGEPQDKAGSYAIQGLGAFFIEHVQGSYSAVVGLPLAQTYLLLEEIEQEIR
ncbi:MAG: septum formation inhibitor Maf [Spongiibacteraceae bacterium]|nr:septum formation inhibitor Maf [Spongiibacteraceae bacterium]